jgi:hypothetical protein
MRIPDGTTIRPRPRGGEPTSGFAYRIDPPLLRVDLLATAALASFRPFRGSQDSTAVPADIAAALWERAEASLDRI